MKVCTSCSIELPEDAFFKRSENNSLRSHCKVCLLQQTKARNTNNKHKSAYKYNLKVKYGLSVEDYNELYLQQQGKCAICSCELGNRYLSIDGETPHIDHSHITNKVRNLLCTLCNKGLGSFKDNIYLLDKAKEYLENHNT